MSWAVSWPRYITASNKSGQCCQKWQTPPLMSPPFCHKGDMCSKVILDVASRAESSLIYGYWESYTTASWFDAHWNGCLPDTQHCLVSQRLPTELFSSAPFLHAAIFPCVLRERGDKASANLRLFSSLVEQDDPKALPHAQKHTSEHMLPTK